MDILTRVNLLYTLCYEIPCTRETYCKYDTFDVGLYLDVFDKDYPIGNCGKKNIITKQLCPNLWTQ